MYDLLRGKRYVVPAVALQAAGIYAVPVADGALLRRLCMVATYSLLFYVVWLNRRFWSVRVIALGLLLNALAMAVGLGLMPVAPDTMHASGLGRLADRTQLGQAVPHSKDVLMLREDTALWPLTDSIAVDRAYMHYAVSPGDLLILAGVLAGLAEFFMLTAPVRTPEKSLNPAS